MRTLRQSPIGRQLEAYEEAWKEDHREAMQCRGFEETLAVGINLFRTLCHLDEVRRQRVADGCIEPDSEDDTLMLEAFTWWLQPCERVIDRLNHFEGTFDEVDGAAEFRLCHDEAREIVSEWRPAQRETTVPETGNEDDSVVAHTDRVLRTSELAAEFDKLARPTGQGTVALKFNPDDYPLF